MGKGVRARVCGGVGGWVCVGGWVGVCARMRMCVRARQGVCVCVCLCVCVFVRCNRMCLVSFSRKS